MATPYYYPSTPVALLPSKLDAKSSHGHIEFGFVFIAPCAPRKFQPKLYPNSKHNFQFKSNHNETVYIFDTLFTVGYLLS
jgi:hypothetical protein